MDRKAVEAFSDLLRYPGEERGCKIRDWIGGIVHQCPELAPRLLPLGEYLEANGQTALEELFVRTFENNAERALELGWHLHGENYARGAFMARVRGLLRELGIEESIELPDHASHLLAVVAKAEHDTAMSFATRVIDPGLIKIIDGFSASDNPYLGVLKALRTHLRSLFPEETLIQVGDGSHE